MKKKLQTHRFKYIGECANSSAFLTIATELLYFTHLHFVKIYDYLVLLFSIIFLFILKGDLNVICSRQMLIDTHYHCNALKIIFLTA